MKCWECRQTVNEAVRVSYVQITPYDEAVDGKFRSIGLCCYPAIQKLKVNGHILVAKIGQRKLKQRPLWVHPFRPE